MEQSKAFEKVHWHEWSSGIIDAFNMKKHSKEWKGPCPVCGGDDRFWINEHIGEVKVHCRHGCSFQNIQDELKARGLWPNNKKEERHYVEQVNPFNSTEEILYHDRKGVDLNGAVIDGKNIVIRITNANGDNVGTQTIAPNGFKKFNEGMQLEAAFSVIKGPLKGLCYVAEGWATAASVSQATGRPTVFALNSSNLPHVVKAIKSAAPQIELIVAADNDGPGLSAAVSSGVKYAAPQGYEKRDWNDVHLEDGIDAVKSGLNNVIKPKSLFSHVGDLELKKPEWHIEDILEKHALAAGFGAPAAGKTFVLLDMVLSVASGVDYHGHSVEQGTCFYIAGEGHNGFARRCMAWANSHSIDLKQVPFFKSNKAIVMNEAASVELMHQTIKELSAQYGKPSIVCIDTVARSMGGDENSTKDMGEFIKQIDKIKDEHGCTVLLAHHTGVATKDRARGSSALLGALDCEFKIERFSDTTTTVTFTKMKDAQEPDPIAFLKVHVPLMTKDMDELSSIVLEKVDMPKSKQGNMKEIIKQEYEKLVEQEGDEYVSRSKLKANVAIESGKSARTVDRDIKAMIDVQDFAIEKNRLAKAWTS
ncbi:MAG: AAA family ATPase [Alphaproteobacteria bacterium]|jgi:hypothetical protein